MQKREDIEMAIPVENVPEVYVKLADQINSLGFGFDHTPEGYEYSLFMRFYTPEEAQWSLEMPMDCFFTAADFAQRTGRSIQEAQRICEGMAMQGQIYRETRNRVAHYRVQPMIAGIWEAHIKLMQDDIDAGRKDWIVDENMHIANRWAQQWYNEIDLPPFRCVPIETELVTPNEMLVMDDARAIIRSKKLIAACQCLCRTNTAAMGGYDDPDKLVCLSFDEYAQYYLSIGTGVQLTTEQCIDLLERKVAEGHCIHVENVSDVPIMCFCDSKTCALLQAKRLFPGPAMKYVSHYEVVIDEQKCLGDGACLEFCPAASASINPQTGKIQHDDHCLACGQCVKRCPTGALTLKLKDREDRPDLPVTLWDMYESMQVQRKANGFL